jgi:hypothetical protein
MNSCPRCAKAPLAAGAVCEEGPPGFFVHHHQPIYETLDLRHEQRKSDWMRDLAARMAARRVG